MDDITIKSAQTRDALRKLYDSDYLSTQPLAKLTAVTKMRERMRLPESPASDGIALRTLLVELIEQLGRQPATQRYYHPLKLQYVDRQKTNDLADAMNVAERTFYLAQNRALKYLTQTLVHIELQARSGTWTASPAEVAKTPSAAIEAPASADASSINAESTAVAVPFLAPLRPITPLVGRDELMARLHNELHDNKGGLTALLGLPGMGKTAVATALAHSPATLAEFSHGVLWAALGATPDVNAVLAVWLTALGMAAPDIQQLQSPSERAQHVRARIGMRRMLLVIDDVSDYATLSLFLLGGPNSAHLVTTQSAQLAAELADFHVVSDLDQTSAMALLEEAMGAQDVLWPQAQAELMRLCGGMPLALRLVARRLRQTHGDMGRVTTVLSAMADPQTLVSLDMPRAQADGATDGQHRPWSIRAALEACFEPLSAEAQATLATLAEYPLKPQMIELEQIRALTVSDLVLDEVLGCGLLEEATGASGAYWLHPVVAAYVRAVVGRPSFTASAA